jgi:hypothetical protein
LVEFGLHSHFQNLSGQESFKLQSAQVGYREVGSRFAWAIWTLESGLVCPRIIEINIAGYWHGLSSSPVKVGLKHLK